VWCGLARDEKKDMKIPENSVRAFSLIEVILAIGIVAMAILSTIGLLTIGLEMNRDSVARTGAASIAREVSADFQMLQDWGRPSPRLRVTPNPGASSPTTFYVSTDGTYESAEDANTEERIGAAYRVDVSFGPAAGAVPPTLHVVVSWPTGMAGTGTWPAPASSIYEVVSSLSSL
jgi:uncharacterized protein (TIGR02598 family)